MTGKVRAARLTAQMRGGVSVIRYVRSHPANQGHVLSAFARAVAYQIRGRVLRRPTVVRMGTQGTLLVYPGSMGASKAVYANPPDWPEMPLWAHVLRAGDTFVDIGANVGIYSVWAAICGAFPIAVEPDPSNAARTRQNLALNTSSFEVHELALGRAEGRAWFSSTEDATNHLLEKSRPGISRQVTMSTLDLLIGDRTIRGAKIDVEGFEHDVLRGAERCLSEHRIDVLQVEWNSLALAHTGETRLPTWDALVAHGYRFAQPDPTGTFLIERAPRSACDQDFFAVSPAARDVPWAP